MLNPNTTLNENTETGDVPENLKIEAPELYETPDYTLPNEPSSYERKGFGFDPSGANKEDYIKYFSALRLIRERGGDEMLRRGGVMNCLYSINNMYRYIPANEAYREFFGGDIPIEQAEAELDRLYDIAANSEDALGKFLKLDDARQEKIIRQNVQGGRVKKAYTATGSSGGAIVADIDNPDFDMGKGREEYENILRAKNTWEGYLQLRNNFSPEVVRDAMRFKTATAESRSNVAEAVLIKMREKGPEYRAAFLASLDVLGVNIKDASDHNFFERAFTRISEAWTDSGVNMADKFWYSRTDGRVLYGMAEEMGLIDESGNLTEDASKLGKLKQAYEDSQNTAAIRALGSAGGWGSKPAYKDTEIQKLFDEGKENIETRRMYRNLRANLATQYNYSGDEWKTLEDMFVYGEYTLRAIGVSAATLAATKNPFMASLASVPMMFAEETARMYSELRLDAGLTESQASLLAMQYGVAVSAAEQFQLGRFMGSFVGKSAAKSFKEYVFNNFKGGVKKAIKESALETGVELSQNTYDLSTKIFATEAFGAGFNTDQLLDNYVEDFKSAALITPLITTFIFGVGAPFRFSGTLSNVGANYGTVAKTLLGIKPSEVVENNVETFETIRAAGEYEALVKSKYGATEQGRDFLLKYLNAKDSVERNSILQKRFPDAKERAEAKLFLENFKRLDSEAFDSILKVKIEAAQKREAEAQSILKGDTTDISALDAETTDEAGNISYEILNSAIDALGMRDDVVFVNNAQELAQASGMSLNAAEDVISRKGAKGFFDEKNGKIAIIKSHFASGADALQSFAHEYGHKIMAKIRANDLNGYKRMCSDVLDLIGGEAVARASLPASYSQVGHANYAKDSLDVAEESLMRVLEQVALKRVLDARKKSVWARFKGWFQKLFSEKSLADITNERLAQIALDVLQKEKSFNVSVPNAPSRNWRAKTPEADGEYVSGEWEVVDAGDLKTSLDAGYDDALQPRNRGRQSSKEQVLNIANNLDPELLDNDPRTSDGAPIVDSRSMAVSGNGRILAIRQAYESGKAEEYRRHVLSRANSMGIDVPAGIKNPVLIRRVMDTGNMSIEELAARSNKSSVAGMSVAEQAVADGRRISEAGLLDIFFPGADGNILAESNRDFNNAFLNLVGGSETFRNKDGSLRTNLSPRVRAAVLAAMLNTGGNRDIVERLLDNPEGYNALINGLMQCAANLAELAQKPQYDISGELSQAVELYIEMHDKGQTVAEFEAQPDMFREQPSAEVMFLCRLFEANQKSPSGISGVLKEYAAQCKKIDTTTADLFGEEDPSKLDKLQAAYDHYATDLAQGQEANARWKIDDPSSERVEKLKNAKSIEIGENSYEGLYELNAKSAFGYVMKHLRGKKYTISDTGEEVEIGQVGARKITTHDRYNKDYLRTFAAIPQMIENAVYLGEESNERGKGRYDKYRYYACGLKIGGRDYTARLTIGERNGKWYYDQALTEIEKGDLIEQVPTQASVLSARGSPNGFIDNRLISLLQENSSKKWREVSEPSPEEIAEANRQKAEVKAKWTNPDGSMKKGYHCAPNGKPSKLTEEQWLLVRTPNFKKWFGDWETLAIINEVENMPASAIKLHESLDKAGIKEAFKSFGEVENRRDGRVVVFPSASAGKIRRHKGFDSGTVIKNFKTLFETAIPAISEEEVLKDGHKAHGNIDAVEHYVNKFSANGNEYFIRFTVPVIRNNKGLDNIHSSAISEVSIYKNGDSTLYPLNTAGSSSPSFIDRKLADFLNSVKPENVSKVVDENGEPMVMYHGTEWNPLAEKSGNAAFKDESYFTDKKDYANRYKKDGKIYEFYLNLKKPFDTRNSKEKEIFEREFYRKWGNGAPLTERGLPDWTDGSDLLEFIREKGYDYDGIILDEGADGGYGKNVSYRGESYVPINSTQIKSATDNAGTFNPNNPDIRWREVSEAKRAVDEWVNPDGIIIKATPLPEDMPTDVEADDIIGKMKLWLANRYGGKTIKMQFEDGSLKDVLIDKRGIKESMNHLKKRVSKDRKELFLKTLPHLRELLESAKFVNKPENKHGQKLDIYKYIAYFQLENGEIFDVDITIKENLNGTFYYDHNLTKIKTLGVQKNSDVKTSTSSVNDVFPKNSSESQENNSRLKALLRQERSENPVIWASIVLAREILLGRPITSAKIDKVLPQGKFDGTKRQYALDRAKHIAEHCKATQKNYANRIDEAVKLAEIDVYWKHDVMEEMYRSYRKDGEEYGIAKQKLLDWIKNEQRKDLEKVKGFSSDELGIDVPAEIENALQEEPVRKKAGESQGETEDKEEIESIAEDGIDDEILGTREKLAPSSLREIIDKIRIAVTKKVKARGGDEQTRRRVYRNTLVEVLSESAKELTYGREREAIMNKIAELSQKGYAAIKIKEGERAGQKIDNYTLRAEHIALRIFNRGVRDTKAQLLERFGGIIKRKGKKPSRMERDDKRKMAGAVQMRIYKIGKFAEMDAAELEAEYFAAVDKLNNAGVHFAGDSDNGETNKDFTDIEDIRAEAANTIADIQRFGNLREKSRADMAGAVEFLEKHIEEEMQKQEELIAKKKEEAAKKRKVVSDALRMSKHNAHKDGALRSGGRALINKTMPFDSLLAVLGEYATGETFLAFDAWRKDLVARIDRAAALVANETFRAQERLINIVEECYSENFSDALKRLLKPDAKYEEFSNLGGESEGMKQPMSLANVLQLYASALQENYRQNVYAHRAKKNGDVEKLQMKIDEILESYPDKESKKGEGWKSASEEIKSLENRIVGLQKNAVSDYIERIEKILTDADKKFVELLRKEYADALPALSAVSRRVIGLPIEQADALYIPVKIKREKTFGEAAGQVPVVPKILSPRVQHMRDFDETANPISLYLDRVRENAQFKYFSELYIEMRSIFGSEELQDLISQRCGSNTLQELLDFVVDISTGQTRGYKDEYIQKANGLFALVALGFNLGSGVRQILPGCFSWGTYIGTPSVLKNMAAFFTPEGFSAALEIWRSENGRRRFSIGNLQIMEEMLATPDQNKFWALFKRYALVFNRASDMLAISFVGQGVYRAGVENYLRQGFNEAKAKEKAMADMWQIAERTQASGRMHNMARWQRRGGDLGKGIGMFSAPPQLMFSKSAQDIRRAIALGIKTPEGRVAAWQALKTWATVSILVEGSYAASGVLWNALLKGFFDDDDDERIIKQMATGPFGGLFLFGRMIENSTSNRGIESIMPVAGLARPAGNIYDLTLDLMTFDLDKALEDLDKLGKSTVPLYRDFRKVIDNRILEEN